MKLWKRSFVFTYFLKWHKKLINLLIIYIFYSVILFIIMKNNSIDDISIERSDLYNFFSKINNLKVPYFQREYTWDRFQINQLINDIASSDVENYYIGSIVISKKDDKNFIIDGQQRISTFILIINYLLIWPCVDKVNFKYRNEFWLLFEKFHR